MYQYPASNFHDLNLDWLLEQMKNCLAEWEETKTDWENLEADNTEFKSYVTNYLQNLDVSDEISAKIDALIADGTFLELLTEDTGDGSPLSDTVGAWLNAHITQETGYVIDDTLTVSGAAADAKAAGDAIADVKNTAFLYKNNHIIWQSGSITGGAEEASTIRIRSTFLPSNVLAVSVNNGYKYGFYAYQNGVYAGTWNGSAIVSAFTWFTTPTIMTKLPSQYQYRILMAKTDNTSISISDSTNLIATVLNDAQIKELKSEVTNGNIFQESQISGNIVPLAIETLNGYLYKNTSGQMVFVSSDSFKAYVIPVKSSTKYYSSGLLRFVVYLDEHLAPTENAQTEIVTAITTPNNAKYIAVSSSVNDIGDKLIISEQITLPPKTIINAPFVLSDVGEQCRNQRYTGTYSSAVSLSKYPNTLKKGIRVFLSCDVSSIGNGEEVTVSFYSDTITGNSLRYTVTSTELIFQRYGDNASPQAHGLTITNNIQMMIGINAGNNQIVVELTSNGQTFTRTFTNNANASYNVYPRLRIPQSGYFSLTPIH